MDVLAFERIVELNNCCRLLDGDLVPVAAVGLEAQCREQPWHSSKSSAATQSQKGCNEGLEIRMVREEARVDQRFDQLLSISIVWFLLTSLHICHQSVSQSVSQ